MCNCEEDIELQIIILNIDFFENLLTIIKIFKNNILCCKSNDEKYTNSLLNDKHKLEVELKLKLDKINKTNTNSQTMGNLVVTDKLKILAKNKNICNIILFLMGRTSYIRGYCSALLITPLPKKYYKLLNKTISHATKLENELFDTYECLCSK